MSNTLACPIVDGSIVASTDAGKFKLWNPANLRQALSTEVVATSSGHLQRAVELAADAVEALAKLGPAKRRGLLLRVIELFEEQKEAWTQAIHKQSGLPLEPRLRELEWKGMIGQLKGAAGLLAGDKWRQVVCDETEAGVFARWNVPIGPSLILAPNNFPLRFGGSSGTHFAYSIVAGNPVLVKPHPSIAGAEFIAAKAVNQAVTELGFPTGTFAFLPGEMPVGEELVKHLGVKLILFTGSAKAAKQIRRANLEREVPAAERIEAGALNASVVLESVFDDVNPAVLADSLFKGTTPAAGAFCTKDGVLFTHGNKNRHLELREALAEKYRQASPMLALSPLMAEQYGRAVEVIRETNGVLVVAEGTGEMNEEQALLKPILFQCDLETFLSKPRLQEEVFGPCQIYVHVPQEQLRRALLGLPGSLVASVHASKKDIEDRERIDDVPDIFFWLSRSVGRVTFCQATTGVLPGPAMVHAGPEPACNYCDTASGEGAIAQVVRPLCADRWPTELQPVWTLMQED